MDVAELKIPTQVMLPRRLLPNASLARELDHVNAAIDNLIYKEQFHVSKRSTKSPKQIQRKEKKKRSEAIRIRKQKPIEIS